MNCALEPLFTYKTCDKYLHKKRIAQTVLIAAIDFAVFFKIYCVAERTLVL